MHAASIHSRMRTHVIHVINEILLYTLTDDMDKKIEENLKNESVRTRSHCFLKLLNFCMSISWKMNLLTTKKCSAFAKRPMTMSEIF